MLGLGQKASNSLVLLQVKLRLGIRIDSALILLMNPDQQSGASTATKNQ